MKSFLSIQRARFMGWLSVLALLLWAQGAFAGTADISNTPPSTLTSSIVRPNLMFVLDDSGSMAWDYLPDSVGSFTNLKCFGYSGYNGVYFNPNLTYKVPKNADGSDFAAANFTAAKVNGFSSSSSTSNLSNPAYFSYRYTVSGPTTVSVSCTYGTTGCTNSDTTDSSGRETVVTFKCTNNSCSKKTTTVYQYYYYTTLNSGAANDCTDSHYTAVTSSATWTADQKQNYANWYQYYRTRIMMMKSAAGRVFDAIDPTRFRVGFSAISYSGVADGSKFLNINDFDASLNSTTTQKSKFFSLLYAQSVGGSTPLRPALVKMGQYFAHKASSQTVDPMQYSCQRNFTLLSTDGYWNTGSEPSNYIPKRFDGTAIGDVDGVTGVQPPKYDAYQAKNSLADIAKYFYDTDIRTTTLGNCTGSVANQDVCTNKTSTSGDVVAYQNMNTFTLGLGVPGVLNYTSDYDSATSGDFHDIVTGAKNWPDPLSSSVNGLADGSSTVTSRIDDLWHAAVNAGGRYYSARDPDQLVTGLTDALQKIDVISGSSSGAATSTLQPVVGDDWVFLPKYETKTWVGDIAAYHFSIDSTGVITIPSTPAWSAASQVASQANQSARSIFFFDSSKSNKLNTFTYSNLSSSQKTNFDNLCQSGAFKLSQCAGLTTNALAKVTGANVVDYLRGNRQYEMSQPSVDNEVFRTRTNQLGTWTPLGDVIDSAPVYVRVPPFKYADPGYSDFQTNQASRPGMVYVGTNDGMLHAFRSDTGAEQWAFVPSAVMPNLYALADERYATSHRYYVDATPVVADVFDGSKWHTILVSGLGAGGREYFALDITDPTNPQALWEFTDTNLGMSFGRPVVAKNKGGQWFVAFTSGYNNTNTGDGVGRLYVVDALTGTQLTGSPIATSAGDTTTPSNLGQINAWVETSANNTALRIYGGDMLGNIWRFDYDDNVPPSGREAFLLGTAKGPTKLVQPITTPPLLYNAGTTDSPMPLVIVGTGRYLGQTDLGNTDVQSLYAVRDKLDTTTLGTTTSGLRGDTTLVQQQMNSAHLIPSPQTVDWSKNDGWYVDFDQTPGERINVEMDLQLGQITVATTVPSPTPCSPGGTSWLYYFWASGTTGTTTTAIPGTIAGAQKMDVMLVGVFNVLQSAGTDHEKMVTVWTGSDQSLGTKTGRSNDLQQTSPSGGSTPGTARRTSWRELVN